MRLHKGRLVDPARNTGLGIVAVALSFYVFAYSTEYGKPAILLLYALWLPLIAVSPRILLSDWPRILPFLAVPSLCLVSTLWSDAPQVTLRGALQYASTIACALIAARVLAQQTLVAGGLVGTVLVLAHSFANGHYAYDVVDGSYAFAGAFDSKNQLGYFSSVGMIFALSAWMLFSMGWVWRLLAIAVGAWSVIALSKSDSATSIITVAGTIAVLAVSVVLFRLRPSARRVAICVLAALVVIAAIAAWQLGAFEEVLQAFGKNETLTGRTYLWSEGLTEGAKQPVLGVGYLAFWIPGRPHAERLWEEFYITAKTGFHFHDLLIEVYVELGLIGVAVVSALLVGMVAFAIRVMLNRRRTGEAALAAGLALLFVVRSIVEIDFFTPYTVGTFLTWFVLLQMSDQRTVELREITIGRVARQLSRGGAGAGA